MSTKGRPLIPSGELYDLSDDRWADFKPECPICGAEEGQSCSEPDPDDDRLGVELGSHVHLARIVGY